MTETDGLEGFLNDVNEPVESAAPEAVQETPADLPRDDQGRFAPKGEPAEPVGESPAPEQQIVPPLDHAALIGERRRRQEAEARIAELEQARQPRPEQQQAPDMFEDPAGYNTWVRDEARRSAVAEMKAVSQQTTFDARLEMSEMLAREKHADFDEKLNVFADIVQQNPALRGELMRAPNPAEYAYTTARNFTEIQRYGSTDIDAIKAAIRAEVEAEFTAKAQPQIPSSLADAQSARVSTPAQGLPSLDEILRRKV